MSGVKHGFGHAAASGLHQMRDARRVRALALEEARAEITKRIAHIQGRCDGTTGEYAIAELKALRNGLTRLGEAQ